MSDLYKEYGLEMETEPTLTEEPSIPDKTPAPKKSGGWLRSAIALILGIVIGVGGVAGGAYYVLTQPARPIIETVGGYLGMDYETQIQNKFLAESYEDKPLLEIGKELASVIRDKNLVGISHIAPVVGEYLDTMVNNMNTQFGVVMDTDTILTTPFAELPNYLGETFRTTPLGNMLLATSRVDQLEPILMEVCYGEEGVHYYLDENGKVVMNEGYQAATFETFGSTPNAMINNISLAAVLPPRADDTLMMSMAYGREGVSYVVETNEDGSPKLDAHNHPIIKMLPLFFKRDGEHFYDYQGNQIDCTIETLENDFIKMEKHPTYEGGGTQIYYLKADESGKYYAYSEPLDTAKPVNFKKTMLGDLTANSSAMIENIYLKDALSIRYDPAHPERDPHKILFSLAYGTEGLEYTVDPVTREIKMIGDAQPRTIGDLRSSGTGLINDVALSDIMGASTSDLLSMYLLYGKKGIHFSVDANDNVVMLQKYIAISEDGEQVYNEYGERLQKKTETSKGYLLEGNTFTDANGVRYTYQAAPSAETVKTPDGEMAKYYLYIEGEPANFTKHSLGELAGNDNLISRLTNRLGLGEVLGEKSVKSNKFLKHVSDCTITEVPNAILNLSITDMFYEDIYAGDHFLQHQGETPLVAADGKLIAKGEYYTQDSQGYHVYNPTAADLKSTWKYLLTDPNGEKAPSDYKAATDMSSLLTNMTENVQNATLYQLKADGILSDLSENTLKAPLVSIFAPNSKTEMGALTITEMLDYAANISKAIAELM